MNVAAKLCMVFLGVMASSGLCFGETIYVDQTGGGDYLTIADAINVAYPDDIIKVGPGIYNVTVSINKNIKLVGSGPKYTSIISSSNGIEIQTGITTEIRNFTITAGGHGIFLGRSSVATIANNIIVGCGGSGIYHNETAQSTSTFATSTITNNTIIYNNGSGVSISHYYETLVGVANVNGNIIAYNGQSGLNLDIKNKNISYNNIYNNTSNYNNCTAGTGDISINPLFIDQGGGNYALLTASNCIDKGIPGEPYNDPDGTRNDMGAYSGPNAAAFWPYVPRGPVVTEVDLTPASVPRGGTLTIRANGRVQ